MSLTLDDAAIPFDTENRFEGAAPLLGEVHSRRGPASVAVVLAAALLALGALFAAGVGAEGDPMPVAATPVATHRYFIPSSSPFDRPPDHCAGLGLQAPA